MLSFTVNRDLFLQELLNLQTIFNKKTTVPVMSGILIEVDDINTLKLTASNLDSTLSTIVPVQTERQGTLCLLGEKLFSFVGALSGDTIVVRGQKNNSAEIISNGAKFTISGFDPDKYPEISPFSNASYGVTSQKIVQILKRVSYGISEDAADYKLSGVNLEFENSTVRMVTADRSRLVVCEFTDSEKHYAEPFSVLIPKQSIRELYKLSRQFKGEVLFGADNSKIYCQFGNRWLTTRRLDGQFIDYQRVLFKDSDRVTKSKVALKEFSQTMLGAEVAADETSNATNFIFKPGQLGISSTWTKVSGFENYIPCDYMGEEFQTGFKAACIRDFLKESDGQFLQIEFDSSRRRFQFKEQNNLGLNYLMVLAPLAPSRV